MKKTLIFIATAVFCFQTMAQVKYDSQDFASIDKIASKIASVNAKPILKSGVKKVLIIEFFGEFVTSKETSPSAFEQRHSSWYNTSKKSIEMGSDYYETVTNEIFARFIKILNDNGIEVLDKETLLNNQDYIDLGLKEERTGRQYTGGVMKQSTTSEVTKRSVSGMGMFTETLKIGAIAKLNQMIPKIAHDNECQAAIKVKFRVGLGKKFAPTLDYMNATIDSNIKSYKAGKDKVTYAWQSGGVALFTTSKGLISQADITGEEEGAVDVKKYTNALMELVNGMSDAYSSLLNKQLAK